MTLAVGLGGFDEGDTAAVGVVVKPAYSLDLAIDADGERLQPPGRGAWEKLCNVRRCGQRNLYGHDFSFVARATTAPSTVTGRGAVARRHSRASVSHLPGTGIIGWSNSSY